MCIRIFDSPSITAKLDRHVMTTGMAKTKKSNDETLQWENV